MNILWAPWRKIYIRGMKMPECVFCDIQNDRHPDQSIIIYKGKFHFVVLNKYPYTSGHCMVVPYCHISRIAELKEEALVEWWKLTDQTMQWIQKAMKPQGFNLGLNVGKTAGAGIENHLHFHIIPRWSGDTNFMTTVNQTRIQSQTLEETCLEIKNAI